MLQTLFHIQYFSKNNFQKTVRSRYFSACVYISLYTKPYITRIELHLFSKIPISHHDLKHHLTKIESLGMWGSEVDEEIIFLIDFVALFDEDETFGSRIALMCSAIIMHKRQKRDRSNHKPPSLWRSLKTHLLTKPIKIAPQRPTNHRARIPGRHSARKSALLTGNTLGLTQPREAITRHHENCIRAVESVLQSNCSAIN